MFGRGALVAAVLAALAQQAVVLEVVDDLQEREADDRLDEEVGQHDRPERDGEAGEQHDGHRPGAEDVVARAPRRAAQAGQAGALELPGRAQAAGHRARPERVEALAEARAGRVLGRGDADVVAAVVLDEEVPVAGLGERDAGQPALERVALVAELVCCVDGDAADHGDGERQPDVIDGRKLAAGPQPAGEDEPGVLDRQVGVGAPAVVAVLFEPLDDAVGRVAGVHPDGEVEQREDGEDEEWPVEPEDAQSGGVYEAPGEERERRDQQAEQPGIALGVVPARGRKRRLPPWSSTEDLLDGRRSGRLGSRPSARVSSGSAVNDV